MLHTCICPYPDARDNKSKHVEHPHRLGRLRVADEVENVREGEGDVEVLERLAEGGELGIDGAALVASLVRVAVGLPEEEDAEPAEQEDVDGEQEQDVRDLGRGHDELLYDALHVAVLQGVRRERIGGV